MAITDLIERIESDAAAEAAAIIVQAKAEAAQIVKRAEDAADSERVAARSAAERAAAEERETLLANARLSARDALLGRKREHAEGVLKRAEEVLETLPDDSYVALIASAVVRTSAGGDVLSVASADAKRLAGLASRLGELGVQVTISAEPAPIERGVLLIGDRVRVEISPASLVDDMRDELLLVASRKLFGDKG